MAFESFQKFIPKAAAHYGISTEMQAAAICHHCRQVIPDVFKDLESPQEYISPAFFREGTIVLNVKTPGHAQEVLMRKEKIIKELNSKLSKTVIKNLRTQLGS